MKMTFKYIVQHWKRSVAALLFLLAVLFVISSLIFAERPGDTDSTAQQMEKEVGRRMAMLESYMDEALNSDPREWLELQKFPEDMVVYRYVGDTLQSWNNQFAILNDDITSRVVFFSLSSLHNDMSSPLSEVGPKASFMNLGNGSYLVKSVSEGPVKVIGGLRIVSLPVGMMFNAINPRFHISSKYSITRLSDDGGTSVSYDGIPQFKVMYVSLETSTMADSYFIWMAWFFFMVSALLLLYDRPSLRRLMQSFLVILLSMAAMYFWGRSVQNDVPVFSPRIYADGRFLFSLGAVAIINTTILALTICIFMMRRIIYRKLMEVSACKGKQVAFFVAVIMVMAGILAYTYFLTRSIIRNSVINLELYRLPELSPFSFLVYTLLIAVLLCLPLLAQLLVPVVKNLFGKRFNAFSLGFRAIFSILIGAYLVIITSVIGLKTEQDRVGVWANRLSMDRDIFVELQLRGVENQIEGDIIIASLSVLPNSNSLILNRIVDTYLSRISQSYDISTMVIGENTGDPSIRRLVNEVIRGGTSIGEGSRFMYSQRSPGHFIYASLFTYFNEYYGVSHVLLTLEPKSNREDRGYSRFLDSSSPGALMLPAHYSYARYGDGTLLTNSGKYSYPTRLSGNLRRQIEDLHSSRATIGGYYHFINYISDDEVVIISHEKPTVFHYIVAAFFIGLIVFALVSFRLLLRGRLGKGRSRYFKNRITSVLMASLIMTLVVMAAVSVYFVYSRNDANMKTLMTDKITSIQTLVSNNCRNVVSYSQINNDEMYSFLETASEMSRLDITLYTPSGKAFMSTTPEIFDRRIRGVRVDPEAYEDIVYNFKGYHISHESIGPRRFYSLYAPVVNADGDMLAILSAPYVDDNFDFRTEAVLHSVAIFVVFVLLLILARLMISAVMDGMFKPLTEIGRKMNSTDIDTLQYISYDQEDEITSLVEAYNRMVRDLSESTHQLALAERDKAWNAMARQVAHEIKNPLTPMKLQMQRLVRMKQRSLPGWEEKFDEASKIVLEHIDILSDTANEFSTFAKLYTEQPTRINLDGMLQEEIEMFDNKDNIRFSYMGLEDAVVMGPKPQLTRVVVNLITNSVQAIEMQQEEAGEDAVKGEINISLRNSSTDGYYDIVFEDNGPGVASENLGKLFTPNFTTKSGGTGIGLAICRSILEKCEAEISYSRSFTLGGACFTIRYPKG